MEKNRTPNMVGFYSGSDKIAENTQTTFHLEERTLDIDIHSANTCTNKQHFSEMSDLESRVANVQVTENHSEDTPVDNKENLEQLSTDSDVVKCDPKNENGDVDGLEWNGDKVDVENGDPERKENVDNDDLEWKGDKVEGDSGNLECDADDDDDDSGWITPENFHQACEEMGGVSEEKAVGIAVGCTTTDFAMQVCVCICVE